MPKRAASAGAEQPHLRRAARIGGSLPPMAAPCSHRGGFISVRADRLRLTIAAYSTICADPDTVVDGDQSGQRRKSRRWTPSAGQVVARDTLVCARGARRGALPWSAFAGPDATCSRAPPSRPIYGSPTCSIFRTTERYSWRRVAAVERRARIASVWRARHLTAPLASSVGRSAAELALVAVDDRYRDLRRIWLSRVRIVEAVDDRPTQRMKAPRWRARAALGGKRPPIRAARQVLVVPGRRARAPLRTIGAGAEGEQRVSAASAPARRMAVRIVERQPRAACPSSTPCTSAAQQRAPGIGECIHPSTGNPPGVAERGRDTRPVKPARSRGRARAFAAARRRR